MSTELTIQEDILYNMYFEFQKLTSYKNVAACVMYHIIKNYIDHPEIETIFKKIFGEIKYEYVKKNKNNDKIFEMLGNEYQYCISESQTATIREKMGTNTFLNFATLEIKFLSSLHHPLVIPNTKEELKNHIKLNEQSKHHKYFDEYERDTVGINRLDKVIQLIEAKEQDIIEAKESILEEDTEDVVNLNKKLDFITDMLNKLYI